MTEPAFRRLAEDVRRNSLLEATLTAVADHGLHGASVRRIAETAGVSASLIRHYFASKDDMVRASYAYLMARLTGEAALAADAEGGDPAARLTAFIAANLTAPNLSSFKISLWATYIGAVRSAPGYAQIHRDAYQEFLVILERLIRPLVLDARPDTDAAALRRLAIALNGLIDGLWLEGSLEHGLYDPADLPHIGVSASEGLLRLPPMTLTRHLPDRT